MIEPLPLPRSLEVLADICRSEGYTFQSLDPFSNQLVRVSNGRHFFFTGLGVIATYPLNSSVVASIVRDKAFTYQALAAAGIDVPPYEYVFLQSSHQALRGKGRERNDAFVYAERLGYPVFVKPIDGSRGALADIAYDARDLDLLLDRVGRLYRAALIQPVFTGADRRVFVIDGDIIFGYRRLPAELKGDGTSTIRMLLGHYNNRMREVGITPVPEDSPFLRQQFQARSLTYETILPADDKLVLAARTNISAGGRIVDYTTTVTPSLADWARRIMAALGLRVCAIDYFHQDTETSQSAATLIEVNSNPNLGGILELGKRDVVEMIWRRVAQTYFQEAETRTPWPVR